MQIRQQSQINFLLIPLYVRNLQFISNKLRSLFSSHSQLRELVFLFLYRVSFFETSDYLLEYSSNRYHRELGKRK